MQTINVNLEKRAYPIQIERGGLLTFSNRISEKYPNRHWVIITQPNLAERYGTHLKQSMQEAGLQTDLITIPVGESAKTLSQIERLYTKLVSRRCDRGTMLIALGGGVVGDVTGFVAATYMRGIDYIQLPTTLLAMIDSSIGGKTGVNLPQGKNLVGAIYQPKEVMIDPNFLDSLPIREKVSGFAEMLKYGLIRDKDFFQRISDSSPITDLDNDYLLEQSIIRSCEIKAEIVSLDEWECGLRRILNFGHTIGHALEILSGPDILRHGEAVAYGMLCAGFISYKKGMLTEKEWAEIEDSIRKLHLPKFEIPTIEDILHSIKHDKKNHSWKRHFVLLDGIGNAVVSDQVSDDEIRTSLEVL
ncbi:MAG: 3-dehydroquinate synthase [Candidatus Marinimicrobia bacterium]|nr:3-dehydroquinate synthase [Candidatus Neomarinimicrobiota bacterium]MBL7060069.1 3-dehydroquinate synthase [Candidatus Neomarinimicrobiota bacterium]